MVPAQRTTLHLRLAWALVPTSIAVLTVAGGSAEIATALLAIDSATSPPWFGDPAPLPAPVLAPHIRPPRAISAGAARRPIQVVRPAPAPQQTPLPHHRTEKATPAPVLPWESGLVELLARREPADPATPSAADWHEPDLAAADGQVPYGQGATGLHLSSVGEGSSGPSEAIALSGVSTVGAQGEDEPAAAQAWDRYAAASAPPRESEDAPAQERRLPPERVAHVVHLNRGRLRACYQQGLVRNPSLAGRVAIRFAIESDGRVGLASAVGDLGDEAVAGCIARAFQALRFPATGGARITVTYPLVLSPGS
ncbi:MAG: AgmX/PglI C-terminal domain-containing protein [Deltaproteobacteria bacterium]|nr:AgmX/PglI C-terminal domain-containing protein [Deltaproteobacteria bacterium]